MILWQATLSDHSKGILPDAPDMGDEKAKIVEVGSVEHGNKARTQKDPSATFKVYASSRRAFRTLCPWLDCWTAATAVAPFEHPLPIAQGEPTRAN